MGEEAVADFEKLLILCSTKYWQHRGLILIIEQGTKGLNLSWDMTDSGVMGEPGGLFKPRLLHL